MNIVNIIQRTPAWHTWRAAGITASEAAAILNRSPYMTPWRLWAERTGMAPAEDLSTKPCVQRGIALEDQARQRFEERHDTILLPACVESAEYPVLRASLDGLSNADEPVELKIPMERTYQLVKAQRDQSVAYQLYWVQCQCQMYVTGAERGWLVFDPCLPDTQPIDFPIVRNETFLRTELVPACLAFWDALSSGKGPEPNPKRDLYTPVGDEARLLWKTASAQYRELATKRRELETKLKVLRTKQDELEEEFVSAMGAFLLADTGGLKVTRYMQSGTVDYPALLKEIAPSLDVTTLNRFRRQSSERVKVTVATETTVNV